MNRVRLPGRHSPLRPTAPPVRTGGAVGEPAAARSFLLNAGTTPGSPPKPTARHEAAASPTNALCSPNASSVPHIVPSVARCFIPAQAQGAGPVASVADLRVTFRRNGRDLQALRGVSIDISPGEIVALVGESGSGKSVLGLTLLGLHPPATTTITGRVEVCGHDVTRADPERWRRLRRSSLGAVFQDPMTSLNPTMRIGRQVAEVAGSRDEGVRLLNAAGMPDAERRLSSFPHELSGGLRQRVMLAMAIAGSPRLVIADEPTTALDVTVQAQILELLSGLRDDLGMAILFITHDLGVASQLADRIAVLYGGRLMELGPAADILDAPVHPYSAGLLRSRLTLGTPRDRPVGTLPGETPDPTKPPAGCPFAERCTLALERCQTDVPTPSRDASGHDVACWRAGDVARIGRNEAARWVEHTPASGPAVLLHGVAKSFKVRQRFRSQRLQSLRGVDLEIAPGEVVALVGESGSGKSTLLRAIAGLVEIDGGSIELGAPGRPQMVFQDAGASLTPWLSVATLLRERLSGSGATTVDREERVRAALAAVGLPQEVATAKPRELSGGQRQRVALARAIVVPPPVLLCDEPTSALDVSLAATILNLIGQLRRDLSMAVLFVTHDLAVARVVADRVAVMYLGRIVEIGPVEEVVREPRHPYTAALLASVPEPGRALIAPRGQPASALDPPPGCAFEPRCDRAGGSCRIDNPVLGLAGAPQAGPRRLARKVACHHPLGSDPTPVDGRPGGAG